MILRVAAALMLSALLAAPPAEASGAAPFKLMPLGGFLESRADGPPPSPPAHILESEPKPVQVAQASSLNPVKHVKDALSDAWNRLMGALSPKEGAPAAPSKASKSEDLASYWKSLRERFQIVRMNLEGTFQISEFQSGSSAGPLEGGRFGGVFAPAFRVTEDSALVFVYTGSYSKELQFFTEDEGPRQRSEEQRHELILLYSRDYRNPLGSKFIDRLTVSPSFFQTYVFTRQTAAEDWGNGNPLGGLSKFKGLYDYWDRGGGVEVKLIHERGEQRRDTLTLASQAYLRHYRNFISLARILDKSSAEPKFEKDYFGILGRASYEFSSPTGLSLRLAYTYLNKFFTEDRADKNPLQESGVAGERRRDVVQTFDWSAVYAFTRLRGLRLGMSGSVEHNESSSGFNDTLAPLSATGAFTQHYYDYVSFRLGPDFSLSRPLGFNIFGYRIDGILTLSGSYSYERRAYRDRKAKDQAGGFRDGGVGTKDETEVDVTHRISPRLTYQFNKKWIVFVEGKRTIARSNFEDDRTFRYNYDINSFGMGVQYRF